MKPICFPSTCISDSVVQAMRACFGQFIIYQPLAGEIPDNMRCWVKRDVLDVRVPVTEDQKALEAMAKNYLNWADLHFNGSSLKTPYLQTWKDTIPFFKETSSSQIVADVKEQVHREFVSKGLEPLMAARLFLYFAQEFDRKNQEVVRDLKQSHQQEAELLRQLKMEDETSTAEFQKEAVKMPDDFADYMVLDRLEAWSQILLVDTDISGIFITHIPAVFQELLDNTPTAEELLHFESISGHGDMTVELEPWQQDLVSDLTHIVEHKWEPTNGRRPDTPVFPDTGNTVSLKISIVPDQTPKDFFSRCAQIQYSDRDASCSGDRFKNTLIGLIGC